MSSETYELTYKAKRFVLCTGGAGSLAKLASRIVYEAPTFELILTEVLINYRGFRGYLTIYDLKDHKYMKLQDFLLDYLDGIGAVNQWHSGGPIKKKNPYNYIPKDVLNSNWKKIGSKKGSKLIKINKK